MTDQEKLCPICRGAMESPHLDMCVVCSAATQAERRERARSREWAEKKERHRAEYAQRAAEHPQRMAQIEQLAAKRAREPMTDRREPGPCRRCLHHELVRCAVREQASDRFGRVHLPPVSAIHVAASNWGEGGAPVGVFHAYICRSCGFTEWYVAHPEDIPIGPQFGTELVTHGSGPYR